MNLLEVRQASLSYRRRLGLFRRDVKPALLDVSFDVQRGETLGVIGRNGSGKSTLLRVLAGIYPPDSGSINSQASSVALMTLMLGFDPVLSGRDNALFGGMLLGFSRMEVLGQIDSMKEFSGLGADFEKPVGGYSSGMASRLSFSVAINLAPDVMLIDEVLAVGDESFRKKAYAAMSDKITSDQTAVFVSHSAVEIERLCDRVILLDGGQLLNCGDPAPMIAEYRKLIADS